MIPPLAGDLNCNGRLDRGDVRAFIRAVRSPQAWQERYSRSLSDLLAAADFNHDEAVTIADVPGFCMLMRATALVRHEAQHGGGFGGMSASADLDIDSDNDDSRYHPARSVGEDSIEDDTDKPGKIIRLNDDDDDGDNTPDNAEDWSLTAYSYLYDRLPVDDELVCMVLEPTVSGASAPDDAVPYRLNFPANVRVFRAAGECESDTIYCRRTFVRGDMNGDGVLDNSDIDCFIDAILGSPCSAFTTSCGSGTGECPDWHEVGDMNRDGFFDDSDIDPFVDSITAMVVPQDPLPIYLWVEGVSESAAWGDIEITADVSDDLNDCDGEVSGFDASDAVRVTVNRPQTGAPRGWGGGMGISPFSEVDLQSGNVLTAITLTAFAPIGPPVAFTVYHNSLGPAGGSDTAAWGFDLGPSWSVSYGAHIEGSYGNNVTIVGADGHRDLFTYDSGDYTAPAGVHDWLTWDGGEDQWTLNTPGRWKMIFDDNGRLIEIIDSSGNVSAVERDGGRLDYVASAADGLDGVGSHRIVFSYDDDKLASITDAIDRAWTFDYDGSGRLWKINYPSDDYVDPSYVEITYDSADRIATITSRDGLQWDYDYGAADGRLQLVTDPLDDDSNRQEQQFTFPNAADGGLWDTLYIDRRENEWHFRFDDAGNLKEVGSPQGAPNTKSFAYDADHNRTSATDELEHTWTYTYGPIGNVETVTSPLGSEPAQTWTITWEQADELIPNFYRVTRVEDPVGDWVEYAYEDENDATHVTSVTQIASGYGPYDEDEPVTTLEYYDSATPEANGRLRLVTDANNVKHLYNYNKWGYFEKLTEGFVEDVLAATPLYYPTVVRLKSDPAGRPNSPGAEDSHGLDDTANNVCHNVNDDVCGEVCVILATSGGPFLRLGDYPGTDPAYVQLTQCSFDNEYDVVGRPTVINRCMKTRPGEDYELRKFVASYDALGRVAQGKELHSQGDGMGGSVWSVSRDTPPNAGMNPIVYDEDSRILSVHGPDDEASAYTYDALGRVHTIARSGLTVEYTYDDAGRLTRTDYGNGAYVTRHYDEADRLEWIKHYDSGDTLRMQVSYTWNLDNTVATRTEYDNTGMSATTAEVGFQYDHHKRLRRGRRDDADL